MWKILILVRLLTTPIIPAAFAVEINRPGSITVISIISVGRLAAISFASTYIHVYGYDELLKITKTSGHFHQFTAQIHLVPTSLQNFQTKSQQPVHTIGS